MRSRLLGLLLLGMCASSHPADARTWRVERDGSGRFTTIQPALDAAARGDTVLIGPGRYLDFAPFAIEDILIKDTFAGVSADSLTLIGAGAGSTIIGPETPSYWGQEPTGIAMRDTLTYLEIRNLVSIRRSHPQDTTSRAAG
jgi:hypothetical protein